MRRRARAVVAVVGAGREERLRRPPIGVGIDIGGGYWFLDTAQFDLHLRVEFSLGKVVALGLRPGLLLNVRPNVEVGLPVDAYIRFKVSRLYFDVLGGLAVLFGNL